MKSRRTRAYRNSSPECLEVRSLLSGPGGDGLLPPGTINPSFGTGGFVTSAILGPTTDIAAGVAIQRQADGKIVVAGTARGTTSQSAFAVTRENADGSLDTTFGTGGTVLTEPPSGSILAANAMTIQADGKILVAGIFEGNLNNNFAEDFAVVRYNADGSLDTTFGTGGEVLTDFGPNSFSEATSVSVTPGGKIVVAGIDGNNFALARYNPDGTLDRTFGTGGEVVTVLGPETFSTDSASTVIQPDGKIVLAGAVEDSTNGFRFDFGVVRYRTDGSLDTGFGNGGIVVTAFGPSSDIFEVAGLAIEPGTNAIVVAGSVQTPPNFPLSFALARYNTADGSLDASFGTGGEVVTPSAPGTSSTATGIAIQPSDGAIVVSGTTAGEDSNQNTTELLTVARYKAADGSLDAGFGTGGEVRTSFGPGTLATGSGVAVQADGKIVAAASVGGGVVGGFGVARYTTKGSPDAKFGTGGKVLINIPMPAFMSASSEAVQSDGKIVVAGSAEIVGLNNAPATEIVLTRFNKDGSLDTSFGTNGSVTTDFGSGGNVAVGVTIEHDGRILVAADVLNLVDNQFAQDIGVAQYTSNGTLDRGFGRGGEVLIDFGAGVTATASGVAIENDGTIVVSGTASGFDANFNFFQDFALAALNKNGSVDTAFGTHGQVVTSFGVNTPATSAGIAIGKDGKIVVAGTANDPNTFNKEFALARYSPNGTPDNSFGTGGEVVTSFGPNSPASIKSVAIQPDGKVVVAGSTTDQTTFEDDFALARYNVNGRLDASFGTGGEVVTSFGPTTSSDGASVAIQNDGKIVVAGTLEDFSIGFTQGFGLARYNTNGSLDQGFGTSGKVVTNFGPNTFANAVDVVIGDDGELFVAGTLVGNNFSDFLLASYGGKKDDHHR